MPRIFFNNCYKSTNVTRYDLVSAMYWHTVKVLSGQLDGSTTFVSLQVLSDMRRWTPKANHSDCNLSDIFP